MKIKNNLIIFIAVILLITLVSAQDLQIKLNKNVFQQGEPITFTVYLYDNSNNQIPAQGNINVKFQDASGLEEKTLTIPANEQQEINLGSQANFGYWKITASYQGKEITQLFSIESNEQAQFDLEGNTLKISNTGNILYSRTVQIALNNIIQTKDIRLNVGETTTLKLLAPDGLYNIEVTDGKTKISKQNIYLSGNAVAIISNEDQGTTTITGVNRPITENQDQTKTLKDALKESKLALTFILAIFALSIIIIIQRVREQKSLPRKRRR